MNDVCALNVSQNGEKLYVFRKFGIVKIKQSEIKTEL